ncbi:Retrotransposon gag protein [Abeliophyllum distichum]|uniref:Retrotransposon gag protein n=1 Tax=Abeliophyllum distichum TaxID=126358 RepID=A0ABD1TYR0_9LAMI
MGTHTYTGCDTSVKPGVVIRDMMGHKIAEAMSKKGSSSKGAKKISIGLMQLIQDKDKMLKDFTTRFNMATLGIKDLHMSVVVTAMMSRTRSRPFKISLSKNPPDMMHELLRRGDKYVDTEEAYLITKDMKDRKKPESNKRKTRDEPKL